jgi:hypothetical protein
MTQTLPINSAWIASEIVKGMQEEQSLAADCEARAGAPPDPALSVLYHEMAAADERHATVIETIATRYGHTPTRSVGGGISQVLGSLKDKVGELGSSALDQVGWDLAAKARSVHRLTAWVHTFSAIGDAESARELSAVLAEDQTHAEALQQALNRMVEQNAHGGDDARAGG